MHMPLIFAAAGSLALTQAEPVRVAQAPAPARAAPDLAAEPVTDGVACAPRNSHASATGPGKARKLNDVPPMQVHFAVDRRQGGCPVPALAPGAQQR